MKSRLDISLHFKNEKTVIKDCFFEQPYKIIAVPKLAGQELLEIIVMCASPGILSGDELFFNLNLEENCQLKISTQAYQRLFTSELGMFQTLNFRVDKGATLVYLPHPVVPHRASVFTSVAEIFLEKNANLIWSEILTPGRTNIEELFSFHFFQSKILVYQSEKLVFKDFQLLEPKYHNLQELGLMEGFTHQSILVCIGKFSDIKAVMTELEQIFENKIEELIYGISELHVSGFILRILGKEAEELFIMHRKAAEYIENSFLKSE